MGCSCPSSASSTGQLHFILLTGNHAEMTDHRHIVDSQSFPLFIPNSPQLSPLSQNGAYMPSQIYTIEDVQTVIHYAGIRGIDVVMVRLSFRIIHVRMIDGAQEIDTPGHTDYVALSYPELVACHERRPWSTYVSCQFPALSLPSRSTAQRLPHLLSPLATG